MCSLDVAQPSATVRKRSRDGRMAVSMVSSAKGVTFGGFTCGVALFRVAGMALRDIQTRLVTCRKSFCVAGAILLRRLQKIPVAVVLAGAAFWRSLSSFYVAGAAL